MGKLSTVVFGLGTGAALMYFMDKDHGSRRRARVRDQAMRLRYQADDAIDTGVRDLRNRMRGILAEGMATVSNESPHVNDQVLAERVRARLGILTLHKRAIDVIVQNHTALLMGDVLASEVERVVRGVNKVRGIHRVENRMRVHTHADGIPQLRHTAPLEESRASRQWTPATRLIAAGGSAYLLMYGIVHSGLIGTLAQISGILLGARAIGNVDLRRLAGVSDQPDAIHVRKSINIQAPVDEVYGLWSNFENFPRFMANIEAIKDLGDGRSHWVVKGPAGSKVEFDAVMTENKPNEVIAWRTVDDAMVKHHGQVRFKEGASEGTQVNVNMAYNPPAGVVGHVVANVFGVDPKSAMDEDLARLKTLLEEGETRADGHTVTLDEVPTSVQPDQDGDWRNSK